MRLQGDSKTGAGHAGLMDMLNDIFAPGKEHQKEQQQYDERVGRRESKISGKPLDFGSNQIAIVVPDQAASSAEVPAVETTGAELSTVAMVGTDPQPVDPAPVDPAPAARATTDSSSAQAQPVVKKPRAHRNRR